MKNNALKQLRQDVGTGELLERMLWLARLQHQHKQETGEPVNIKHLEAVLYALPDEQAKEERK